MGTPRTVAAFQVELELLSTFLANGGKEIIYKLPTYGQALHFRQRCYALRKILRESGDVRFESILMVIEKGSGWITLRPRSHPGILQLPSGEALPFSTPSPITISDADLADLQPPENFSLEDLK